MGRYADALPVLKGLPPRIRAVEDRLAEAYVGLGNDAEARDLLRRSGRSEAEVAEMMEQLRVRIRSRPTR